MTTLAFPGGPVAKAQPTRAALMASAEDWAAAVEQYAEQVGRDLRNKQIPSERLAALKSAMGFLERSIAELRDAR